PARRASTLGTVRAWGRDRAVIVQVFLISEDGTVIVCVVCVYFGVGQALCQCVWHGLCVRGVRTQAACQVLALLWHAPCLCVDHDVNKHTVHRARCSDIERFVWAALQVGQPCDGQRERHPRPQREHPGYIRSATLELHGGILLPTEPPAHDVPPLPLT